MKKILLVIILIFCHNAFAKNAPLLILDGLFLQGHDPVSYVKSNKAKRGDKKYLSLYQGEKVLLATKENHKLFSLDPAKYIPQYNGWCAYALAKNGELVASDPQVFKVIDGKVYLFYKSFFVDTLKKWNEEGDEKNKILNADYKWRNIQTNN